MKAPRRWQFTPMDTALIVVDSQNDYLSPGGGAFEIIGPQVEGLRLIDNLKKLVIAARLKGIPVFFSRLGFEAGDYEIHGLQELSGLNRFLFEQQLFLKNSWGAEMHPELRPVFGDFLLSEHKNFNVFYSNLSERLGSLSIEKLILAGVGAETTIACTANSGCEMGFDVTVVKDAIVGFSESSLFEALLWSLPFISNLLIGSKDVEHLMFSASPKDYTDLIGASLYSSDNGWIGTITGMHELPNEDCYLKVELALPTVLPLYVPAQAIAKASGTRAYLNVAGKLVDMCVEGWREEAEMRALEKKKAEAA